VIFYSNGPIMNLDETSQRFSHGVLISVSYYLKIFTVINFVNIILFMFTKLHIKINLLILSSSYFLYSERMLIYLNYRLL